MGVFWNTNDLLSCKQAAWILLIHKKVPYDVLRGLNFGNLDLDAALGE